jgi:PKD repeat protein
MSEQSEARADHETLIQARNTPETETAPSADDRRTPTSDRPTPAFDYAPGAPVDGNPVLFDADVSTDATGRTCEWNFGDGTTASGEKASNVYDSGGEKSVTLTITDDDGATAEIRETVTVYREVEVEICEEDGRNDCEEDRQKEGYVPVEIRGTAEFDPTEAVAAESLRFGAPTALAMGSGAVPVGNETCDGTLRVWFRADETGLRDDASARLAGRTTDDVPLAGTADAESLTDTATGVSNGQ